MNDQKRIYLDHAATTPLCAEAREAVSSCLEHLSGNPSGIYQTARSAKQRLEEARAEVARLLGAHPDEIYFTSGGSESDNWALKGIAFRKGIGSHLVTTAIEHPAVLNTCRFLEKLGHDVTYLQPDREGRVCADQVRASLKPHTALVSVMAANNEIGTVEPIEEIAAVAQSAGIPLHVDAVQAIGDMPFHLEQSDIGLLSLSAHKFYGPKGIGVLYLRRGLGIEPLIHGGEQERGLRASTENVAAAAGLAAALKVAESVRDQETVRLQRLRNALLDQLRERIPELIVNGSMEHRLSNNLHLTIPGTDDRTLIPLLDLNGVEASAGSACTAGSFVESHVLKALGVPRELLRGSLRLTLGRSTNEQDILTAADRIVETVNALRKHSHV